MRNRFDRQLENLNEEMIEMGAMIESAIEQAVTALVTQDVAKAKAAIKGDADIDRQEKEIENICLKLLLQQQPVARDLRQISSALKMITDMERIGDHAADISACKSALHQKIRAYSGNGKGDYENVSGCHQCFCGKRFRKGKRSD